MYLLLIYLAIIALFCLVLVCLSPVILGYKKFLYRDIEQYIYHTQLLLVNNSKNLVSGEKTEEIFWFPLKKFFSQKKKSLQDLLMFQQEIQEEFLYFKNLTENKEDILFFVPSKVQQFLISSQQFLSKTLSTLTLGFLKL